MNLNGKLHTDSLEDRFGKYRQLAGIIYYIRRVYEIEQKIEFNLCSVLSYVILVQ